MANRSIRDNLRLATTGNEIETAIIKATDHAQAAPKEKHVQTILIASGSNIKLVVDAMKKQLKSKDWIVVLKMLQVFHRAIQEGSGAFAEYILREGPGRIFNLSSYIDHSSPASLEQSTFIRKYSRYIEERIFLYRDLRVRNLAFSAISVTGRPDSLIVDKSPHHVFSVLHPFQLLMTALLDCKVAHSTVRNGATLSAFSLLLQDSFVIFQVVSLVVLELIDIFFTMNKEDARKAMSMYDLHLKQTEELARLYSFARTCQGIRSDAIPEISVPANTLMSTMMAYIESNGALSVNSTGTYASTSTIATAPLADFDDDVEVIPTANLSDLLTAEDLAGCDAAMAMGGSGASTSTNSFNLLDFSDVQPQPKAASSTNPFDF